MNRLLIQEALRSGRTIPDLIEEYKLITKVGQVHPNLIQFRYDQLESPMGDPLVQQCRGLILDSADDWAIVAWGLNKFFNLGEGHAAAIDWSTARVLEKLDGSLIQLYWYQEQWHVSTSGTVDASGIVDGNPFTFAELFWRAWSIQFGGVMPANWMKYFTTSWELTSPYNKIVVQHKEPRLSLLALRHRFSGFEWPIQESLKVWNPVRTIVPITGIIGEQEVIAESFNLNPAECEGFVVVDTKFNRVKVKSPAYVALHHMRGEGLNPKRLVQIVVGGEIDELLIHFPEWAEPIEEVNQQFKALSNTIEACWSENRDIDDQKTFALQIKHLNYASVLFSLRAGHVKSVVEGLRMMQIDRLLKLLGMRDTSIEPPLIGSGVSHG